MVTLLFPDVQTLDVTGPVEVTLTSVGRQFHVTWTGSVALPGETAPGSHRLLVTESETFLRTDLVPGDPNVSMSPLDFVRERVVYADVFER